MRESLRDLPSEVTRVLRKAPRSLHGLVWRIGVKQTHLLPVLDEMEADGRVYRQIEREIYVYYLQEQLPL